VARFSVALSTALLALGCLQPTANTVSGRVAEGRPSALKTLPTIPQAEGYRLPDGVRPLSYDLSLHVDPREQHFSGRVRITAAVDEPTRHVILHARGLTTTSLTVDGKAADGVKRVRTRGEDPDELVVIAHQELAPGEHVIEIDYTAKFGSLRGLYNGKSGDQPWAFTQFEPLDARSAFPCFDEPRFKTPFTLRVLTPERFSVVSNTPLASRRRIGEQRLWEFESTPALPTYVVALGIGEFQALEHSGRGLPIRALTLPGQKGRGSAALAAVTAPLDDLESYTGLPYPYAKLDIAAVPALSPAAMENPGLITFDESLMLLEADAAPALFARMEFVMAHELAHQWFGNLVTMEWWNDLWLNESFADWMALKVLKARKPNVPWNTLVFAKSRLMSLDAQGSVEPVRAPVNTPSAVQDAQDLRQFKGVQLLTMLESYLGPEAFQAGVRSYLRAHAGSSADAASFFSELSSASGRDVASIGKSFFEQPGVPLVSVDWSCQGGKATVHLEQSTKGTTRHFDVPVCLRAEGEKALTCTLLRDRAQELTLQRCPRWVVPNAADAGYYRYALPLPKLRQLAKQELDEAERTALIVNSWALAREAELLAPSDVLELLTDLDLRRETSPLVLRELVTVLTSARDSVVSEEALPDFAHYVARLLGPAMERLAEPTSGEPAREHAARVAVMTGLLELADLVPAPALAERWTTSWLESSSRLDAFDAALALRISARSGGVATTELARRKLGQADASASHFPFVAMLGAPADSNELRATLDAYLQGELDAKYFYWLTWGAARHAHTRRTMTSWAMDNFAALARRVPRHATLSVLAGLTCDAADEGRWKKLWDEHLSHAKAARQRLEQELIESRVCARLRERGRRDVSAWLARSRTAPP
jgi:cytosol alanyl aminopeptidase